MTDSIEDLNNKAVSLLTQGNYQEAITLLKFGLCPFLKSRNFARSMNSTQQQSQEQQQAAQRQQASPLHNEQNDMAFSDSANDKTVYAQDENIVLFQQDGQSAPAVMSSEFTMPSMMYSKAFCISPSGFDKSDLQSYAVMCYNMGLILHGQGIQLGVSVAFPKALTMYSLSMRLLHQVHTSPEEISRRDDVSHVYLAILNNMGDVYQQLVQEEQASICFQQLRLFLVHLSHRNEELLYRFGFFASNSVSSQYEFPPSPAAAA